jgi:hypothetical protein
MNWRPGKKEQDANPENSGLQTAKYRSSGRQLERQSWSTAKTYGRREPLVNILRQARIWFGKIKANHGSTRMNGRWRAMSCHHTTIA